MDYILALFNKVMEHLTGRKKKNPLFRRLKIHSSFEISKSYAKELESKVKIFQKQTKTKKSIFLTMITTYGIKNSRNYPGQIQSETKMDVLFE